MEVINPVIPVLACVMLIGSQGWLMANRKRTGEPHNYRDSEHYFAVAAHVLFCWYYSAHMILDWSGLV